MCPYIWSVNEQQHAMKNLMFMIAAKIAEDQGKHTLVVCASILKDAFIADGFSRKQANELAIDGMRIITRAMQNMRTQ